MSGASAATLDYESIVMMEANTKDEGGKDGRNLFSK